MTACRNLVPSLLAVTLVCGSIPALADDYRAEVTLLGDRTEPDGDFPHVDQFAAVGTYYLEPVGTDGLPLAEAAFLNRSSFVRGAAVRSEIGDGKIDIFSASLGYYVPDTIFFGRLGVYYADDFAGDQTNFNGSFGITPIDGMLLFTNFDEDGWDPNVTAKYVGKMANTHYYSITASAVDPDAGDTNVSLDFDYYLDDTFSVGAGYGSASDDFALRAQKFFTPSFAVGGHVSTGDDGDGFGASVTWRF
jgi:hypothetical protein